MNTRTVLISTIFSLFLGSAVFAQDTTNNRTTFSLPQTEALNIPISDAVLAGNTLYLSGNGGIDLSTMTVPDDPKEEARLLMENFKATLALADMSLDNLVSVTIYCPDLSLYGDFNEVYKEYFKNGYPARAFIGSGPLLFGMRFEMQAIAVK